MLLILTYLNGLFSPAAFTGSLDDNNINIAIYRFPSEVIQIHKSCLLMKGTKSFDFTFEKVHKCCFFSKVSSRKIEQSLSIHQEVIDADSVPAIFLLINSEK